MEILKIIPFLGFFIVKIAPIFIVFYFIFDSIIQVNLKGFTFIIGLIITTILTVLGGNNISFINKKEPNKDFCFPISINNFVNISNLPISQSIYAFTFFYLTVPLLKYNFFIGYNTILFILFLFLIGTDMLLLYKYNCFSMKQITMSLFIGSFIGIMYISTLLNSNKKNIIYIPGIPQSSVCDLPKRKGYRCRVRNNDPTTETENETDNE